MKDMMEHRDYVYRQGSNTAVIGVVETRTADISTRRKPKPQLWRRHVAPDFTELQPRGVPARPGALSDQRGRWEDYRAKLENDGTLTTSDS